MAVFFFILSAASVAALMYSLKMNRELAKQISTLSDRLDALSRKSGKRFNKYEKKLAQQRHKQIQQAAKQEKLRKEQEKLSKEQRKQAADLRKMQFKLEQATADIEAAKLRLSSLYSLLDIALNNQAAQMPGSPADYRYQKQITSLQHSISIAERQLSKAEFDRDTAQQTLAA